MEICLLLARTGTSEGDSCVVGPAPFLSGQRQVWAFSPGPSRPPDLRASGDSLRAVSYRAHWQGPDLAAAKNLSPISTSVTSWREAVSVGHSHGDLTTGVNAMAKKVTTSNSFSLFIQFQNLAQLSSVSTPGGQRSGLSCKDFAHHYFKSITSGPPLAVSRKPT